MLGKIKEYWSVFISHFSISPNRKLLSLIAIVVVVIALPLTVLLSQNQQTIRQRASELVSPPFLPLATTRNFGNVISFSTDDKSYVHVLNTYNIGPFTNTTIEALIKYSGQPQAPFGYPIIAKRFMPQRGDSLPYVLSINSEGKLSFVYSILFQGRWAPTEIVSNTTIPQDTWTHVAIVYNNVPLNVDQGKLILYINGQRDKEQGQNDGTITEIGGGANRPGDIGQDNVRIGTDVLIGNDGVTARFNGQIDEVRISNTPKYLGKSFLLPEEPFSKGDDSLLLFHFNEESGNPTGESNSGPLTTLSKNIKYVPSSYKPSTLPTPILVASPTPYISPVTKSFGKALKITQNAQGIIGNPSDTPEFTIEAWAKWEGKLDAAGYYYIVRKLLNPGSPASNMDSFNLYIDPTGNRVGAKVGEDGTEVLVTDFTQNHIVTDNKWHHIALVNEQNKQNQLINTRRLFIDGKLKKSFSPFAGGGVAFGIGKFYIALDPSDQKSLIGQIDEVRLSNIARYSSDFTPELAPFVPDARTIILYHFDGDSNDSSGKSNNGQIVGDVQFVDSTIGASSPTPTPLPPTPTPTTKPSPTPTANLCTACSADINKDGVADGQDISLARQCFLKSPTGTCANADINKDGTINIQDITCIGKNFGKQCILASPTPISKPPPTSSWCNPCSADIDKSGTVNSRDYTTARLCYNKKATARDRTGVSCANKDLNRDGIVSGFELSCISRNYGKTCR